MQLVSPDDFEKFLARSLALVELQTGNAFHCRTPDCTGWWIGGDATAYPCPVCSCVNCLSCGAIHEDMDCATYKLLLSFSSSTEVSEVTYLCQPVWQSPKNSGLRLCFQRNRCEVLGFKVPIHGLINQTEHTESIRLIQTKQSRAEPNRMKFKLVNIQKWNLQADAMRGCIWPFICLWQVINLSYHCKVMLCFTVVTSHLFGVFPAYFVCSVWLVRVRMGTACRTTCYIYQKKKTNLHHKWKMDAPLLQPLAAFHS